MAKVPRTDRAALEAGFYLGLAKFNLVKYADAEAAFAFVASRLPLPEIVNNQGVAASRQGERRGGLCCRGLRRRTRRMRTTTSTWPWR